VTFVQLASASESVIVAVPLPLVAAVIVTVLTKLAVSVSVFADVKLHGLATPEQVPPDQPLRRLAEPAVAVIVSGSPT
jgi:hypothetical protein